jgi:tetratricopeptide (TPR) repeat protein
VARYERTGRLEDLEEAIRVFREAVEATPPGSPDRPGRLNNLGGGLFRDRYERTGRLEDLEEAIRVFREAVEATPPGSPDRPGRLNNLGTGLSAVAMSARAGWRTWRRRFGSIGRR